MYVLFMLGVLAVGALVALALISISLVIVSFLLVAGIISSSIAVGFLRKSVAGAFQTLFLQIGAVAGTLGGIAATFIATLFRHAQLNSPLHWIAGALIGFAFGLGAAWLFNRGWMLLAHFLTARVKSHEPPVGFDASPPGL